MTRLGLQIVPTMPPDEVIDTIVAAEAIGYEYCQVADEGLMADVYTVLGAAAGRTSTIRLGVATNGYTRHPAATAAALATVDHLSGGRAFVTLVAGGTMVLGPLGISREQPVVVMRETIEILRRLWSGEPVTWKGERFRLDRAQLHINGGFSIPIFMAVRGPRLLRVAGQMADGVVLIAKFDLGDALATVVEGRGDRTGEFTRAYLDRLTFTPAMLEEAKSLYSYALLDSPERLLHNLGLDEGEIDALKQAVADGGPAAATALVTPDMVRAYQIAGTPEECRQALSELVALHELDLFMMNIISSGLDTNTRLLEDVREIIAVEVA
jgi:5,10-methylenetetrahydromethanopterin reductase